MNIDMTSSVLTLTNDIIAISSSSLHTVILSPSSSSSTSQTKTQTLFVVVVVVYKFLNSHSNAVGRGVNPGTICAITSCIDDTYIIEIQLGRGFLI